MKETIAGKLAEFACGLKYEMIPQDVVCRTKHLLLDQLGCELLGSAVTWNQAVYRFTRDNKSKGPATIVNFGDKVPADDAAFVNGTFGQGCELDDYYDQGGGHPGAASIPVALALAETMPVSGKEFIAGMAVGYEAGWRIGRGLLPGMMQRGYHAQSVVGVFVAAATAGRIKRLDPKQMTYAFAIAGSHAGGTMEYDQSGGEVKRMHSGLACSGGMRSALLAELGLTGPPTIFEGKRGIFNVIGGGVKNDDIMTSLGAEYAVSRAALKRFPVNASQHSPIELLDELITKHKIDPEDVRKIELGVNEGIILHGGTIYEPKEVIEAQFSLRFSLALRLLKRRNDLEDYLDPKLWHDAKILEIGKRIELVADPTATGERRFACSMKITLSGGKIIDGQLSSPKGTSRNPLSKEELQKKFIALGAKVLPQDQLAQIIEIVEGLEHESDVSSIVSLMVRRSVV